MGNVRGAGGEREKGGKEGLGIRECGGEGRQSAVEMGV